MSLRITFSPPDAERAFKQALLKSKEAWFTVTFADGEVEYRRWSARRMRRTSDVVANVRSRFRHWRDAEITRVHVSIDPPAAMERQVERQFKGQFG